MHRSTSQRRRLVAAITTVSALALAPLAFALPAQASTVPSNDDFANAQDLGSTLPASPISGSTVGATVEQGEPGTGGGSVWYAWTPTAGQAVAAYVTSADFPAEVNVYSGSDLTDLVSVDSSYGSSGITFTASANETYYLQVDSYDPSSSGGSFDLAVTGTGTIAGKVTTSTGAVPHAVCIDASDSAQGVDWFAQTDSTGAYSMVAAPGSYLLTFMDCSQAPFQDNLSPATLGPVALASGQALTSQNVALGVGATLSGKLVPAAGSTIESASVTVWDPNGSAYAFGTVDPTTGLYTVPSIGTGSFDIEFDVYYTDNSSDTLYFNGTKDVDALSALSFKAGCSYSNMNADFNTTTTSTPVRSCAGTPECASATAAVTAANSALAAVESKLVSNERALTKLKKKYKKAKHAAKKKLKKKIKNLGKVIATERSAANAASTGVSAASAAASSACH